ncbi:histidine phosphatase family protein [Pedobacter duraquae]|uniref:Alpha-ribazole phosphatase/probable phosphoglycerate mutase n=1 Tax=Pedobacter duraquae TaxID=425511 RepID=A0A4V3C3P8_9SPHI|nr:histidine phosphatase family protein [Pedobacter duraquae]TDO22898.1 alpha-ribazole phosphatase/probable phosphoglycerate mutase [Pedobacter duraquae]
MLNIYLLRHGETTYNADGNRYCGRTDAQLTTKGLAQATAVAEQLRNIKLDAVYASPLFRAKRTAEIASNGSEVETDQRLIEVDFGVWEGKTRAEFVAEDPMSWQNWDTDPAKYRAGGTGESGAEVVERVADFFNSLLERHSSGNILVVAHNGVNRLFLAHKLGMPLKNYRKIAQENSSITRFELAENGELTLNLLNSKL